MIKQMALLPVSLPIVIDAAALEAFCRRWKIARLEVFGSVLREDFRADSDVDFLVTPGSDASWSLFDRVDMKDELAALIRRKADIAERPSLEKSPNWIRRREILSTAVPLYDAG